MHSTIRSFRTPDGVTLGVEARHGETAARATSGGEVARLAAEVEERALDGAGVHPDRQAGTPAG